MLVFGDAERAAHPLEELQNIRAAIVAAPDRAPGDPHDKIMSAFILASELAQGLADAGAGDVALPFLRALARLLLASAEGDAERPLACALGALNALAASALPKTVVCRKQEGFAFYGVDPQNFARAARGVAGIEAVIGIRSIGIGLAAMVAAGTQAPFLASVRPFGPPFRRETIFVPETAARLKPVTGVVAVVDEGPGFSGSSFLSVVRALEALGVPRARIKLFPSHANRPGPEADAPMRDMWNGLARHVAAEEATPWARFSDIFGFLRAPPRDISGGAWRAERPGLERAPAAPMFERRKFLLEGENGIFLLRFAGLGPYGEANFSRAKKLAESGFSPPALGLREGFVCERWIEDAEPLDFFGRERKSILEHLAHYLAFRAARLPADPYGGASLENLVKMLRRNAALALGVEPAAHVWNAHAQKLASRVRRIATDNRLHAWEWLRTADGRLIKTDACEHCADHCFVGCQDLAWDVAGAIAEFTLARDETDALLRALARRGHKIDRELLAFLRPCYLAQQVGLWRLPLDRDANGADRAVLYTLYLNYCEKLAQELGDGSAQELFHIQM